MEIRATTPRWLDWIYWIHNDGTSSARVHCRPRLCHGYGLDGCECAWGLLRAERTLARRTKAVGVCAMSRLALMGRRSLVEAIGRGEERRGQVGSALMRSWGLDGGILEFHFDKARPDSGGVRGALRGMAGVESMVV